MICLRLLAHDMRAAASRTFWTAGSNRPIRMAMMAITTSNSMRVKPRRCMFGPREASLFPSEHNDPEDLRQRKSPSKLPGLHESSAANDLLHRELLEELPDVPEREGAVDAAG